MSTGTEQIRLDGERSEPDSCDRVDCEYEFDPALVERKVLSPTVCSYCFGDDDLEEAARRTRAHGGAFAKTTASATVHYVGGEE